MITNTSSNTFIKNGGFFPLAIKHGDTVFVFCRTDAGHLGQTGKITVLASSNGTDWEKRGTIAKDNTDVRNPSAFIFPDGKMLLAAYKYNAYDEKGFAAPAKYKEPYHYDTLVYSSSNGGFTWTEVQTDFSPVITKIGKVSPHGSMFMYDNQLLMPVYNREGAFLLGSKDKGLSWGIYSQIGAAGMQEPFVIETQGKGLLAVMRTSEKKWAKATVISRFTGREWTEPEAITEPMQHPASLFLFQDGRVLLTYGDRNHEQNRILLKLSSDHGCTWNSEIQLGENFGSCDFGYPSTVEITPGKLLTVFYVNKPKEPYFFFFNNPILYTTEHVKGYYYLYSLD